MGKFILTLLLLTSAWLSAQNSHCNITVRGIVIDSAESKALDNTHIEIIGTQKNANINIKDSIFSIQNVCRGLLEIHFSHLDCEHKDIVFNITKDTFITVYLNHTAHNIGSAKVARKTIIERVTIQGEGSLKIANTLTEQLESSASIRALKTGNNASKPIVNGLHSNRVILVNNGIKQEGQNWGLEHAPEIDANFANDIQVVENVGKLRYTGDAIGGSNDFRKAVHKFNRIAAVKREAIRGNKAMAEETEQLDELKKSTLLRYIPKAEGDKRFSRFASQSPNDISSDEKRKWAKRASKRSKGIELAGEKLVAEESEQLDERGAAKLGRVMGAKYQAYQRGDWKKHSRLTGVASKLQSRVDSARVRRAGGSPEAAAQDSPRDASGKVTRQSTGNYRAHRKALRKFTSNAQKRTSWAAQGRDGTLE